MYYSDMDKTHEFSTGRYSSPEEAQVFPLMNEACNIDACWPGPCG